MKTIEEKDLRKLTHKQQVCFAIFCAEQVTHLLCDKTREPAFKAIETAKLWLEGRASSEDCYLAADGANAASYATNTTAARAAARATYAAAAAASYATNTTAARAAARAAATATRAAANANEKEKVVEAQWAFYKELLEFDEIFEREVL